MINPDDEDSLRLGMFAASMLVIAHRERVVTHAYDPPSTVTTEISFGGSAPITTPDMSPVRPEFTAEARAIADAVVEEAKRLHGEKQQA